MVTKNKSLHGKFGYREYALSFKHSLLITVDLLDLNWILKGMVYDSYRVTYII